MKSLAYRLELIFIVLILVLGFFLRSNNLNTWPRQGATFDEYAWTWQGISLIKNRVPTSWSPHPQYKNFKDVVYQKTHFRMVTPFLEHPPVFGLVAGSFAILNGVQGIYDLHFYDIRPLAVVLGFLSLVFLFLLVKEIYDTKTALIASLLYATIPTIAIGSRIVQNENFFIPFWLLALFFTAKFLKTNKNIYRNLAGIICGLLILAKIPWVAGALSIVIILLVLKKYKDIYKFLLIVAPIALLYLVYGFYFDKELFVSLWKLQLNRYDLVFNSIYALFQKPYLVDRFYTDGWIYFGWFSMILLFLKDFKKNLIVITAFLAYFLIFLSGIPDEAGHGWYRYPFYPFLIISTALFLREYFVKNWLLTFFFLVFVGTSLFQLTWATVFGFSYLIFRISIIGWSISLLPLFVNKKPVIKLASVISLFWFGSFILLNIWSVFLYNEQ